MLRDGDILLFKGSRGMKLEQVVEAPFIGLFGTVWGIMNSFHNIGLTQSASLAAVALSVLLSFAAAIFGALGAGS